MSDTYTQTHTDEMDDWMGLNDPEGNEEAIDRELIENDIRVPDQILQISNREDRVRQKQTLLRVHQTGFTSYSEMRDVQDAAMQPKTASLRDVLKRKTDPRVATFLTTKTGPAASPSRGKRKGGKSKKTPVTATAPNPSSQQVAPVRPTTTAEREEMARNNCAYYLTKIQQAKRRQVAALHDEMEALENLKATVQDTPYAAIQQVLAKGGYIPTTAESSTPRKRRPDPAKRRAELASDSEPEEVIEGESEGEDTGTPLKRPRRAPSPEPTDPQFSNMTREDKCKAAAKLALERAQAGHKVHIYLLAHKVGVTPNVLYPVVKQHFKDNNTPWVSDTSRTHKATVKSLQTRGHEVLNPAELESETASIASSPDEN